MDDMGLSHPEAVFTCAFCGQDPVEADYVEIQMRIAGTPTSQFFGAHRAHWDAAVLPPFRLELSPEEP